MKPKYIVTIILCFALCGHAVLRAQDMDTELSKLTEDLSSKIKENGSKKITVLDFTDLDGNTSELGKYIAEQLTVDFVMKKREFSVLDRVNLKRILEEHKLTASGLINPENAKKLGAFAGVDAMIFGKTVLIGDKISVTAQIISTETAEVGGGAKTKFQKDESIQLLMSKFTVKETSPIDAANANKREVSKLKKTFGDFGVEVESLRVVNGSQYLLTFTVINNQPNKSICVALQSIGGDQLGSHVTDPEGYEFQATDYSGLGAGILYEYLGYKGDATTIEPKGVASATIKFSIARGRRAVVGPCRVQLSILSLTVDGFGNIKRSDVNNLLGEMKAE